jgi:hypothetical protein
MIKQNPQDNKLDDSLKTIESDLVKAHNEKLAECKETGKSHGERQMPDVKESEIEPYEKAVIAYYQAQIADLYAEGRDLLDMIRSDINHINKQLREIGENQIKETISEAEKEMNRRLGEEENKHNDIVKSIHNDPKLEAAQKDFDQVQKRFEDKCVKAGREELLIHFKPFWLYLLFIIGLGIAEVPLNNQVFVSFRETPLLTFIMSLVLVISLPFLAHGSGKFLRQGKENPLFYVFLFISVGLIIFISYYTALLRTNYLATKGLTVAELETDRAVFIVIGLLLFFVGMIASYFAHDPSLEFVQVYDRYKAEKDKYEKIKSKIHQDLEDERRRNETKKNDIHDRFTSKKEATTNIIVNLKKELSNKVGDHNRVLNRLKGLEKKVSQDCRVAVQHYRAENSRHRDNHTQPESWKKELPILETYFQVYSEIEETSTLS